MRTFKASFLTFGIAIAVSSAATLYTTPVQAQWVVTDPGHTWQTMFAEFKRAYDASVDYANQINQLQTQIQQYEDMVKQGMQIPDAIWSEAQANLQQLDQLIRDSQALAYNASDIEAKLKELYPGYEAYSQGDADFGRWARNMDSSVETVIRNAGMQAEQFETEADTMRRLEQQSASSQGRMQAIQVGNAMAAQTFGQLQKLRQLMIAQTELQAQRIAATNDQAAAVKVYLEKTYAPSSRESTERKGY